ncbi:hypothetical protein ALC62_12389, partial [Cyphomyrmex costatus]
AAVRAGAVRWCDAARKTPEPKRRNRTSRRRGEELRLSCATRPARAANSPDPPRPATARTRDRRDPQRGRAGREGRGASIGRVIILISELRIVSVTANAIERLLWKENSRDQLNLSKKRRTLHTN